jgi:hypothetical protein
MLSMNIGYMTGTPADETVYRLSLDEPLVVTVTGENGTSFCMPDGTATADVMGGLEPYSYLWSNGGTTSTISNLTAGTYSVTVTDANSSTATGNVVITSPSPIIVNAESTDESFFNGHDGTASSFPTGGTSPYTYLWSNGSNQSMISGLAPGVYTVTVTDQSDCTSSQSVTVNAFGCPEITLESSIHNVSCFGLCDGSITIVHVFGGSAPFNYDWGPLGETTASVSDLCVGNYSVTITDNNGCIVIGSFEITQPEILLANAGSTNETISGQNDGTAWAAPSGGTVPYLYHWSTGSMDSLIINLSPGSYTVTITDNNLCTATGTVVVDSAACTLIPQIVNNLCFQNCEGSIEITLLNAVSPVSYIWSNGSSESSIDSLCASSYSVTATDALGCIVSATYTVTEPPQLSANAASSNQSAPGFNDGAAWAVPSGGTPPYFYNWNNGSTDSLITNLSIGLYTVTVTDDHGCADVQSVLVEGFPCSGIIESGQSNITCFDDCDGSAGVAVIGGIGPTTYLWNTGDTTSYLENLCPGTYSITINDEGQNCMSLQVFEITQPDELIVNIDQVVNITDSTSGSISVTAQGGILPYTFLWTGPTILLIR